MTANLFEEIVNNGCHKLHALLLPLNRSAIYIQRYEKGKHFNFPNAKQTDSRTVLLYAIPPVMPARVTLSVHSFYILLTIGKF